MEATAIVFPAPHQIELQTYTLPDLRTDEALIRTSTSGVSQGTEIWALLGRRPELTFPTVPGYQTVGIIEALGKSAQDKFHIGQRVLFRTSRLPAQFGPTWMGAHVSHAIVSCLGKWSAHGDNAPVPVPDGVSDEHACLAALPAVSQRGLEMLRVQPNDVAVVIGQGLIGQGSAQLARLAGAKVIVCDVDATRLALSRQVGNEMVVDANRENLDKIVRQYAPNGADIVIETTGRAAAFVECIDLLRWEGQLLMQGWYADPITFDFNATHAKKPTIAISCGYDEKQVSDVLQLMQRGDLNFAPLITHAVPFTQAPEMYRELLQRTTDVLGVVFRWNV